MSDQANLPISEITARYNAHLAELHARTRAAENALESINFVLWSSLFRKDAPPFGWVEGEQIAKIVAAWCAGSGNIPWPWRPIETAPKEIESRVGRNEKGPDILVYDEPFGVLRAHWWQSREPDGNVRKSNFVADGGFPCYPTHWLPLPPAPGEAAYKEKA